MSPVKIIFKNINSIALKFSLMKWECQFSKSLFSKQIDQNFNQLFFSENSFIVVLMEQNYIRPVAIP